MRILLDTNIIIHRETNNVVNTTIGKLFNWIDKIGASKLVHPLSIEEISSHKDSEIVRTMLIKVDNYVLLKTLSDDNESIINLRAEDKTRNDEIDTSILKELYNARVDYIITEDRGIHRKAIKLGIDERVFTIESFIEKVTMENPELRDYKVLSVKKEFFGNVPIKDEFFDSFKEDYQEFEKWFNRKADSPCYICHADGNLGAFLFVKVENKNENYGDIFPPFVPKKRLKIGTFKVTSNGYKLGERFLKIIFDNALRYKVDEIYVTIFDKREEQIRLINLLEDWGFSYWGEKRTINGIEQVLIRDFKRVFNIANPKLTYPFISRNTQANIVPIYPDYHTELLPDSILQSESPIHFLENEPHRNAIQKVYISRSLNRDIKTGDLILFYRTGGKYLSVITTIGIVESVVDNIKNEDDFLKLCRKRSIFNDSELRKHWNYTYPNGKWTAPFIVNFHYIYSFPKRLNLARLVELGIIKDVLSAPRGFEPISLAKLNIILKESLADESYIVD